MGCNSVAPTTSSGKPMALPLQVSEPYRVASHDQILSGPTTSRNGTTPWLHTRLWTAMAWG